MTAPRPVYPHRHLLGIEGLSPHDIEALLALSEEQVEVSRKVEKKKATLRGRTQVNLFFEPSTRTQSSFELAGKRLGADVMNMAVSASRSEEHTSELQSRQYLVCRLLLEKKKYHIRSTVNLTSIPLPLSTFLCDS